MEMRDRLKYLRETRNLTTRAFGATINMSGGAITNMEKGLRNITNRTAKDICREYNVNLDWFLYGKGAMYNDPLSNLEITDEVKQLAKQYMLLSPKDQTVVSNMIDALYEKIKLTNAANFDSNEDEDEDEDVALSTEDLRKLVDEAMADPIETVKAVKSNAHSSQQPCIVRLK